MAVKVTPVEISKHLFNLDQGLIYFAPGWVSTNRAHAKVVPWIGMKRLNRIFYLASTFYYFVFKDIFAIMSIAISEDGKEPVVLEVRDNYVAWITSARESKLGIGVNDISTQRKWILNKLLEFATLHPKRFDDLFENDPNIKYLASFNGTAKEPLFLDEDDVNDYYEKYTKLIFVEK